VTEGEALALCRPIVLRLAADLASPRVDRDDLIQEGNLAAAKAFRAWDPAGGTSLTTWSWIPIRHAMWRLCRRMRTHGIKWYPKAIPAGHIDSMDDPGCAIGLRDVGDTLHDQLGTFDAPPDYFAIARLADAVSALTDRERMVIRSRFVHDMTLEQIGDKLGLTRERARQIEAEALRKLRVRLGSRFDGE